MALNRDPKPVKQLGQQLRLVELGLHRQYVNFVLLVRIQPDKILLRGDKQGIARTLPQGGDFPGGIGMMISEELRAGDDRTCLLQRGKEFFGPPDSGKGENAAACEGRPFRFACSPGLLRLLFVWTR